MITVRNIGESEIAAALELVWTVFCEFEAPDYTDEGIEEFKKSINSSEYLKMMKFYGAFKDKKLVGVIASRNSGNHIALFFVDGKYHRQGIGRKLFNELCVHKKRGKLTVNSSPYAVNVYRHLGFYNTQEEQLTCGLRYTPMEMDFNDE